MCEGSKFYYLTQKVFERSDLYCSIGFPDSESKSNPEFKKMIHMLADYCSSKGYIQTEWVISLIGAKEGGMSIRVPDTYMHDH